ncbi:rhomboid family intramembrane serine protease [Pseudodesulfovibrio sp.]|uniref:rhomboid family intramembrane serine protease n=1 Tax=Pseudodesulfovibrio sp. TaxID=2035812 RepID=UPI002618C53A|nr:rhomboid family intramembrane serine protease [Pseudodesulfovibrio sp.]MDD3313330.1 rhomboid family intramembrane serine protease [Pseudodesulfovibrio sp.]
MPVSTPRPGFLRRTFRPVWADVAPLVLGDGAAAPDRATADRWALVLAARHVPHRVRQIRGAEGGFAVQVQPWFLERAAGEIRAYVEENAPGAHPAALPDLRPAAGLEPTVAAMVLLVFFHWARTLAYPAFSVYPEHWLDLGSADASRILSGEWWRLFTALTLHAGAAHVLGNAVIGGTFVWLASRRLGAGLAWLLTILGGGLGNELNSLIQGPPHDAIGFSTASFAAAGLLAGIAPFGVGGGLHGFGSGSLPARIGRFAHSALVPVGAGLGLLAMLGAGEDTDLGGHFFGMFSGLALGIGAGFRATRLGLPGRRADALLYVLALSIPAAAWVAAWLA